MAVGASKFRVSHSDVSKYKSQIAKLRVAAKCGCGCPIIDFALGSERKLGAPEIVAEAGGNLPKVSLWALFSMLVRVNCLSSKSIPRKDWKLLSTCQSWTLWNTMSDCQLS